MIDIILALINTVTAYNDAYNAAHLMPLASVIFITLIFTVFMPLMMYMMRETPAQAIERITSITHVYDVAIERVRASKVGTEAVRAALIADYEAMRKPFADELAALAALIEGAK